MRTDPNGINLEITLDINSVVSTDPNDLVEMRHLTLFIGWRVSSFFHL